MSGVLGGLELCAPSLGLCITVANVSRVANITTAPVEEFSNSKLAAEYLAGVIISVVLVIALIVWTCCQARLRAWHAARQDARRVVQAPKGEAVPLDELLHQFNTSARSLSAAAPAAPAGLASLAAANVGAQPLTIGFHELGLTLKSGARVLDGVSGALVAGSLTAVMGPSGSGKTTFISSLAGRADYGQLDGQVTVNGEASSLVAFKSVVGFVPQEDVMLRMLTVREILVFSALTRLPSSMPRRDKLAIVDAVQAALGLQELGDSVVGDENVRGISGGQRKRVNIGMELVAAPLLLLLDEPTSGLDASSSFEAIHALRSLLPLGLTIAAVIHQPSTEVWELFDSVVLLAKGGKTVYAGKRALVRQYFENLGYELLPGVNVADAALDIVSGRIRSRTRPDVDLVATWRAYSHASTSLKRMPSIEIAAHVQEATGGLASPMPIPEGAAVVAHAADPVPAPLTRLPLLTHARAAWVALCALVAVAVVCVVLLAVQVGSPREEYLWVTVPFCALVLVIALSTAAITVAIMVTHKPLLFECAFFSLGFVTGPIAVVLSWIVAFDAMRLQLFASAGFGVHLAVLCGSLTALVYMRDNRYSTMFKFNGDVGVAWLSFFAIIVGFSILLASIFRIRRGAVTPQRRTANFASQVVLQVSRSLSELFRTPSGLLLDCFLPLIAGSVIGLTTVGKSWEQPVLEAIGNATGISTCPPQMGRTLCRFLALPQRDPYWGDASFLILAVGLVAVISSLRHFSNKANFLREQISGLSTTAVFVAKTLVSLAITAVGSGIFLAFWGWLAQPVAPPGLYFLLFWLTYFAGTSLGFLVSILLRYELAGMVGILAALICEVFSVTISGASGEQSAVMLVASYFSFLSWAGEAFYFVSVAPFNATKTNWMELAYNVNPALETYAWVMVLILGLSMRVLAWMALVGQEK